MHECNSVDGDSISSESESFLSCSSEVPSPIIPSAFLSIVVLKHVNDRCYTNNTGLEAPFADSILMSIFQVHTPHSFADCFLVGEGLRKALKV